jgi:hypothetical protein
MKTLLEVFPENHRNFSHSKVVEKLTPNFHLGASALPKTVE